MNTNQAAAELLRVAKDIVAVSILNELKQYGEFSKGSKLYFHGFRDAKTMLKALEKGSFGRKRLTSIATPGETGVPYLHRIWFTRPTIPLYPFYYKHDSDMDPVEIRQKIAEVFGIDWVRVQVNQSNESREQEWYALGPVPLNKVKVTALQFGNSTVRNYPELAAELRDWCNRLKVKCYTHIPGK